MIIDSSALDSYRDFMGEEADAFIAEVIGSFLDSGPKLVSNLEEAWESNNQEALVRAAHMLKSNSATLGATLLADLAALRCPCPLQPEDAFCLLPWGGCAGW